MPCRPIALAALTLSLASAVVRGRAERTPLPKVVLVGDSVHLSYAAGVARRLEGRAVVVSAAANAGTSAQILQNLEAWIIGQKPDLVHFNCGLHDLKRSKGDGRLQVEPDAYAANLRRIVERLRAETSARIVFATTTPILDDRHARRKADFSRVEADVRRSNAAAEGVMRAAGVPVHDLHWVMEQGDGGAGANLGADGTHPSSAGADRLVAAVADCVARHLTLQAARPLPAPPSGPEAAAAYRSAAEARDRQVPAAYRNLPIGRFEPPADADAWRGRRPAVLKAVVESLGDLPPRPAPSKARPVTRELWPGFRLESIALDDGIGGAVSALLLVPDNLKGPAPAVLWLHSSTPDKTQVLVPHTNGGPEPLGEVFTKRGYVVLAPDAYWHGDRVGTGPSGPAETGRAEQESLFKLNLWLGRTLWGMFVRDDQIALDYLVTRPEVDPSRIGATGMSMGSTRAWWLAALDDRVAATVGIACLTRYQNLIEHGELRQHGVYYFVAGLLKHFDTEGVVSLIAPRPFLALTGDLDAGSPADGVRAIERPVDRVYAALGAADRFRSVLYPEVGHTVTPAMRSEMLAWFDRWLRPG